MSEELSRRRFLGMGVSGAAAVALASNPLAAHPGKARHPKGTSAVPFTLGVATYSLREFGREDAIRMLQQLRVTSVSVKSFHLPYDDSAAQLAAGTDEFLAAGIEPVSCGLVTFEEDSDEHVQKYFDYAKSAGIPMIVMTAAPQILPRIERFVEAYDMPVAIHNHGPEDPFYPAPSDALAVISDMDARIGVCVDVGHTVRTGADIVESLAGAGGRLLDIHIKDLADLSDKTSQVPVGQGNMPIAEIFKQLASMDYRGNVNLEYEIDMKAPLPGMIESMAYMRGVLAGQSQT